MGLQAEVPALYSSTSWHLTCAHVLPQNESPVVVLKHMPVGTTKTMVRTFFKGFNIAENGIWYVYLANGQPASWGYVVFIDKSEACAAVEVRIPALTTFLSRCCNLQMVDSLPRGLLARSQWSPHSM